jgi:simple sugar transport system ATP-binding protein
MNTEPVLELSHLGKRFATMTALKDVTFTVGRQEVVGLVGDNGAGKSTLINLLMGVLQPTSGEVRLDGRRVEFHSPAESRMAGIEPVYQHTALVDLMSLWRNFFLGREMLRRVGPFRFLDKKTMTAECVRMMRDIGVSIRSGDESVGHFSGGERQSICIGRCMSFGSKLLLLDEPTVALSVKETQKVLDYILAVKQQGISEIIVDHNIFHIFPVVDKFVIIDHGMKIAELQKKDVTPEDVIEIVRTGRAPEAPSGNGP